MCFVMLVGQMGFGGLVDVSGGRGQAALIMFIHLFIYLSIYLFIYLFICSCIAQFTLFYQFGSYHLRRDYSKRIITLWQAALINSLIN